VHLVYFLDAGDVNIPEIAKTGSNFDGEYFQIFLKTAQNLKRSLKNELMHKSKF
jgi:hypothetical protein